MLRCVGGTFRSLQKDLCGAMQRAFYLSRSTLHGRQCAEERQRWVRKRERRSVVNPHRQSSTQVPQVLGHCIQSLLKTVGDKSVVLNETVGHLWHCSSHVTGLSTTFIKNFYADNDQLAELVGKKFMTY